MTMCECAACAAGRDYGWCGPTQVQLQEVDEEWQCAVRAGRVTIWQFLGRRFAVDRLGRQRTIERDWRDATGHAFRIAPP
jgi:hypothetical protein